MCFGGIVCITYTTRMNMLTLDVRTVFRIVFQRDTWAHLQYLCLHLHCFHRALSVIGRTMSMAICDDLGNSDKQGLSKQVQGLRTSVSGQEGDIPGCRAKRGNNETPATTTQRSAFLAHSMHAHSTAIARSQHASLHA